MSKVPMYEQVYQKIRSEIIDGEYRIGDLLPKEQELEDQFGVSRTTIRNAIELLVKDKLIEVKQGRGTRVLDYKTKQSLNRVTSISETLTNKGYVVESKSMYIDSVPASAGNALDFGITEGTPLIRIQRIQLADGEPIAIMKNYLLEDMVPEIQKYKDTFTSLYQFLEDTYGIMIDSSSDKILAKTASFSESQMLGIDVGDAVLGMKRICYQNGKVVCLDKLSLVGKKYEFEMYLDGRQKQ